MVPEGLFGFLDACQGMEFVKIGETTVQSFLRTIRSVIAYVAKRLVISRMMGQNVLLKRYGLHLFEEETIRARIEKLDSSDLKTLQQKQNAIEGYFTKRYFNGIFGLLPEKLRPEGRRKFKAYDGTNNIFNLAYEVLQWMVHRAVIKAKLEPYLGFLHSVQYGKPSHSLRPSGTVQVSRR